MPLARATLARAEAAQAVETTLAARLVLAELTGDAAAVRNTSAEGQRLNVASIVREANEVLQRLGAADPPSR